MDKRRKLAKDDGNGCWSAVHDRRERKIDDVYFLFVERDGVYRIHKMDSSSRETSLRDDVVGVVARGRSKTNCEAGVRPTHKQKHGESKDKRRDENEAWKVRFAAALLVGCVFGAASSGKCLSVLLSNIHVLVNG